MKKGDFIWLIFFFLIGSILIIPTSREVFEIITKTHPYIMAFLKFAILGTMGELLGARISEGYWVKPIGIPWRIIIWGCLGMTTAYGFPLFDIGVRSIISLGLLPSFEGTILSKITTSFFTSLFFNLYFATFFISVHKITDTYIDLCNGSIKNLKNVTLDQVIRELDWKNLIEFIFLITFPFFFIPVHTITFLLPTEYRIILAAALSIVLGVILGFTKKKVRS